MTPTVSQIISIAIYLRKILHIEARLCSYTTQTTMQLCGRVPKSLLACQHSDYLGSSRGHTVISELGILSVKHLLAEIRK